MRATFSATLASNRTAQGAKEGLNRGLTVAFRAGAVMGLVVVGFGLLDICGWLIGLTHDPEKSVTGPWKYVYSVLIYLTSIPGVFAAVVVAYTMFFQRGNLLRLNVFVTFLPIASMVARPIPTNPSPVATATI